MDLVFDQHQSVSIKAGEQSKRGESSSLEVNIHNESTPVAKQWAKFISNPEKKAFLCNYLSVQLPQRLATSQKVVLAGGYKDVTETLSQTQVSVGAELNLCSDHEEADEATAKRQTCGNNTPTDCDTITRHRCRRALYSTFSGFVIAQNAWTLLIIHSHRSGKFECKRALNSPELEEKGSKLVK